MYLHTGYIILDDQGVQIGTPEDAVFDTIWTAEAYILSEGRRLEDVSICRLTNYTLPDLVPILERLVKAHDSEPPMLTSEEWDLARAAVRQYHNLYQEG